MLNWPQWSRVSIINLAQVLEDGAPKSFAKLQEEFNFHPRQEWRYLQLKHCLQQCADTIRWGLQTLPVVTYLKTWAKHKGVLAGLYEVITQHLYSQPLLEKLRLQWQDRLQRIFDTDDSADVLEPWTRALEKLG
ncbi:hypothetical protein NDU88_001804 [Pleurodeles waltl]|uniref:Uncharacterized protein n=1 Tax=Pleurodeles waltl TaxID=8319 RepID=A0AAV7UXR2_PLEWA|nr:hypothetical protein NDU88_001804 [Pleurodeles waltl]